MFAASLTKAVVYNDFVRRPEVFYRISQFWQALWQHQILHSARRKVKDEGRAPASIFSVWKSRW